MHSATAALARSIARAGSKQTYFTARLLVDRDLVDDCLRAYAYFRWADDMIDVSSQSSDGRVAFIERQKKLVEQLYKNERPDDLTAHEEILAELIGHDRHSHSGLRSYIRNFLYVLEFDAHRRGRLISEHELTLYSNRLARAVMDGIQYFIANDYSYPDSGNRYLAVVAAHITHMLRDMLHDIADGYINIPREYLDDHGIGLEDVDSIPYRRWVQSRVELARRYLREGKLYLDGLDVLRAKIAGFWYCARYEGILDTIERDGYRLRADYHVHRRLSTWLRIAWLGVSVTCRHLIRRGKTTVVRQKDLART